MRRSHCIPWWCVAVLAATGACGGDDVPVDVAGTDGATVIFSDPTTCADVAGDVAGDGVGDRPCDHVMCDFVPEGSTFDETCGRYFQEGITSSAFGDAVVRLIAADVAGCIVAEHSDDERLRIGLDAQTWLSISGPSGLIERVQQRLRPCSNRAAVASDDR